MTGTTLGTTWTHHREPVGNHPSESAPKQSGTTTGTTGNHLRGLGVVPPSLEGNHPARTNSALWVGQRPTSHELKWRRSIALDGSRLPIYLVGHFGSGNSKRHPDRRDTFALAQICHPSVHQILAALGIVSVAGRLTDGGWRDGTRHLRLDCLAALATRTRRHREDCYPQQDTPPLHGPTLAEAGTHPGRDRPLFRTRGTGEVCPAGCVTFPSIEPVSPQEAP